MTEQRGDSITKIPKNSGNPSAHPPPTRRRVLKGLAAGTGIAVWHSALPERWITPIIESISLPAHAQTSAPVAAIPQCTNLLMRQVTGDSFDTNLTVSASGQFPAEYAGQVFNVTFEAYKEAVVTEVRKPERDVIAAAADLLSPSLAYAAIPACSITVQVTVAGAGGFSAETTLACGPGYKQVIAVVRTGANGGDECCRGVLDVHGCNPCSTASSSSSPASACGDGMLDIEYTNSSTVQITVIDSSGTKLIPSGGSSTTKHTSNQDLTCTAGSNQFRTSIDGIRCDGSKENITIIICVNTLNLFVDNWEKDYVLVQITFYNDTC